MEIDWDFHYKEDYPKAKAAESTMYQSATIDF